MDPALAWKLGGVAAAAAVVAVAGGQDGGSSEQPHVEALALHPWPVACRHAARIRAGHTCAVAANAPVATRASQSQVLNVRSLQCQLTSSGAG
jgi:hypothetical protein